MSKSEKRKQAEDLNKKGNKLLLKKEFSEAKKLFEKAILSDNYYVDAYFNLGVIYAIKNDRENAFKYFFNTIELDPLFIKAFEKIGYLYFIEGDYKNAAKFYERGLKIAKDKYGRHHPDTKSIYNAISKMNAELSEKKSDYKSYINAQIKIIKNYFESKGFTNFDYRNDSESYHCFISASEKLILFNLFSLEKGNIKALDHLDRTQKPLWSVRNRNIPSLVWEAKRLKIFAHKVLDEANLQDSSIQVESIVIVNNANIINADEMMEDWKQWGVNVCRFYKGKPSILKPLEKLMINFRVNAVSSSFKDLLKTFIEYMEKNRGELLSVDRELMKDKTIEKYKSNNKKEAEEAKTNENTMGRNLNDLAIEGHLPPCLGREEEIKAIYEILYRQSKNNPLLIGHSGVGKTAIIEKIANRIVREDVPEFLKNKQIVVVTPMEIVAGTKFVGDIEKRVKEFISMVEKNSNIILFMDELHTIIGAGAGSTNQNDIAQYLKPALSKSTFTMIGATTYDEYRKFVETDKAFERRFYPIRIEEMDKESTKEILNTIKLNIEDYYNVNITFENIELVIDLCDKYIKKRYFPDKALDILEKVASKNGLNSKTNITDDDINKVVEEYVGIQYLDTKDSSFKRLLEMEKYLSKRIFGQDEAIKRVSNQVRLTKRGLDLKPERPDGVFLFTGPTGVGKTELARGVCDFLYGNQQKLLKLDMSEFSENSSVAKLLGSPPGYIGDKESAFLTKQIEENPSSVLLLDEIEKAHEDVIKLFLQIFDEGKIRDSRGKDIYFSDVTIIMTSNAIVRELKSIGFNENKENDTSMVDQRLYDELSKTFPIEFLNRIDEIILFNQLDYENIKKILEKKLINTTTNRFKKEGLSLRFDKTVIDMLIKKGFDKRLGGRNIERAFERLIISEISNYIYKNDVNSSVQKDVVVSYKDSNLIIE